MAGSAPPPPPPPPPPGWYPDPQNPSQLRWWDGVGWTERRQGAEGLAVNEAAANEETAANEKTGGGGDGYLPVSPTATDEADVPLRVAEGFELPLSIQRERNMPLDPWQVWNVVIDPRRYPEWMAGVSSSDLISGDGLGRRVRVVESLLGQKMEYDEVLDVVSVPRALIWHHENVRAGGRSYDYGGRHQLWLTLLVTTAGSVRVELGAGFDPSGRRKGLELRASLPLMGRQIEQSLKALERLAVQTKATAPLGPPPPAPTTHSTPAPMYEPSRKLKAAAYAAAIGLHSKNPSTRQVSRLARKEVERRMDKQAEATMSTSLHRDAWRRTASLGDGIEHFTNLAPPACVNALYNHFAARLELDYAGVQFAISAAHFGYATRQSEERALAGSQTAIPQVTALQRSLWSDQGLESWTVVGRAAQALAIETDLDPPIELLRLPGGDHEDRLLGMEICNQALVDAGMRYSNRPSDIDRAREEISWRFGFALRCCETSLPRLPGRRYEKFQPRV